MSEVDFSIEAKRFLSSHENCDSQESSFCEKMEDLLLFLVESHNQDNEIKVDIDCIKSIYKRGSLAYNNHYRLDTTRCQWGVCRVHSFLKLLRGSQEINPSYRFCDIDLASRCEHSPTTPIEDVSLNQNFDFFDFDDTEFALARVILAKFHIDKSIQNDEDDYLFLSDAEKITINKPFIFNDGEFGVFVKDAKTNNITLVKFDQGSEENLDPTDDITNPQYWASKFWIKKAIDDTISSDAVEWDEEEAVTEWMFDDHSFYNYIDIINLNPDLKNLIYHE